MPPSSKKKKDFNKLDELLRSGASGLKGKINIDKAVGSTAHRLIKEKIVFKEITKKYDSLQQYQNKGFNIMDGSKEADAKKRLASFLRSKNLTFSDLNSRLTTKLAITAKVTMKIGGRKKKIDQD